MKQILDLLTPFGGKKKKPSVDPIYATFNRRMLAATIDSIFAMLTIAPFMDFFFDRIYGAPPLNDTALQERIQNAPDEHAAVMMFWQVMFESGQITWWLVNTFAQTLIVGLISAICWHLWAATPGKMVLRIKVADAKTFGRISDWQILVRIFGYFISTIFLCLGFVWIGFDKRRQGWHDKMAGTVVIVVPWKQAKSGPEAADPLNSPEPSAAE